MQTKRIIDILKTDNVGISCELFPPKQGTELQNSLEIVNNRAGSSILYERDLWRRWQHRWLFGGAG